MKKIIFIILIITSTCFAKAYYKPAYNYHKNSITKVDQIGQKKYQLNNTDLNNINNQQIRPVINNYNTGFVRSMVGTMAGMYLFNSFTNESELNNLNYENSNESSLGIIFGYILSFLIILLFIYIFYRILKLFFKI